MKSFFNCLVLLLFTSGCQQVQKVTDVITQPTAREIYEREFKDYDTQFLIWKRSFDQAKQSRLEATLPYELSAVISAESEALAYRFNLKEGERFILKTNRSNDSIEVFADLFELVNDSVVEQEPVIRKEWKKDSLVFEVKKSGQFQLIVQPEIADSAYYHISAYTLPSYGFPVSGKDNSAIQSFWGAPRDGGKRSHKGVDIFAARGAPIVATTDGMVSSTGNRGLGGKQVWLRDGLFGKSLYYAHLDSIAVSRGKRVKKGDTLGFVGNTGNARYTKPHLHFGIYSSSGAVDPLPFIQIRDIPKSPLKEPISEGVTKLRQNQIRTGASTKFEKLATLPNNQDLKVFAKTEKWYHVEVNDTLQGFIHESLVAPKPEVQ